MGELTGRSHTHIRAHTRETHISVRRQQRAAVLNQRGPRVAQRSLRSGSTQKSMPQRRWKCYQVQLRRSFMGMRPRTTQGDGPRRNKTCKNTDGSNSAPKTSPAAAIGTDDAETEVLSQLHDERTPNDQALQREHHGMKDARDGKHS